MNIPEFTAHASLYRTNNRYRSAGFARSSAQITVVIPQLGGPGSPGHAACLSDCADQHPDWTRTQCLQACADPRGIPCKKHDNTINHLACIVGVEAWETACSAHCPFLGFPLGLGCEALCATTAAGFRSDCPPAVICS